MTSKTIESFQDIQVCSLDTINSKFQGTVDAMKLKVKAFTESSHGNVSIVLFDFSIESITGSSKTQTDKDFEDAISFSEVLHFCIQK